MAKEQILRQEQLVRQDQSVWARFERTVLGLQESKPRHSAVCAAKIPCRCRATVERYLEIPFCRVKSNLLIDYQTQFVFAAVLVFRDCIVPAYQLFKQELIEISISDQVYAIKNAAKQGGRPPSTLGSLLKDLERSLKALRTQVSNLRIAREARKGELPATDCRRFHSRSFHELLLNLIVKAKWNAVDKENVNKLRGMLFKYDCLDTVLRLL